MAERSPAFQFYPKDWLSSKRVRMMSRADRGSFIDMLAYCWDSEDCALTIDELAFASGLGDHFVVEGGKLAEMFIPHPTIDGKFTNARLLAERKKQDDWKEKCSKGGKRAAKTRASKRRSGADKKATKGTSGLVDVYHEVKGNSSSSSSSSFSSASSSSSPSSTSSSGGRPPDPLPPSDDGSNERPSPIRSKAAEVPVEKIVAMAGELGIKTGRLTAKLRTVIAARWAEDKARQDLAWWGSYFHGALLNDWLAGRNDKGWSASLSWLVGRDNMARVEGDEFPPSRKSLGPPGRLSTVDQVNARLQQLEDEEARDGRES